MRKWNCKAALKLCVAITPLFISLHADAGNHRLLLPAASIIKISPPAPELYKDLVCTPQDRAIIEEIVIEVSQNSKFDLIWEQGRLDELGVKIAHVHPLKFLSAIISNLNLKIHLINIFNDYFKRNGFMGNRLGKVADGLGTSLNREDGKNKLHQYIKDFALDIKVQPETIQPFFDAHDWEGLVYYLIQL